MSDVLSALRRDHVNMGRLLDLLERQITRFDAGAQPDYDVIADIVDYCLAYPDLYHHPLEDLILARLRLGGIAAEVMADVKAEHRELAQRTRRLATAVRQVRLEAAMSREVFSALARDFIALYRQHLAMEEQVLFPAAQAGLSAEDWAEIERRGLSRADPLFGRRIEKRFQALLRDLLAWSNVD